MVFLSMSSFHSSHRFRLKFQCSLGVLIGEEPMLRQVMTGRWSLPQYGPTLMLVRFFRSGELKVRSMVELSFPFGFGRVPRFFGVHKVILSSSRSISAICFPQRFCWLSSSHTVEWAFRSPPIT